MKFAMVARGRAISCAPNIRVLGPMPPAKAPADDGRLRVVFLSRVDRKKNLDYAIKLWQMCARQ